MKTYAAVIATLLLAATVSAQTDAKKYFADESVYKSFNAAHVEQRYLACLSTDNDGVVESALAHVGMMRLMKASDVNEAVLAKVAALERSATSQELRYKAFLTKALLEDPRMFDRIATTEYESADEFFGAIASRMSEYFATR